MTVTHWQVRNTSSLKKDRNAASPFLWVALAEVSVNFWGIFDKHCEWQTNLIVGWRDVFLLVSDRLVLVFICSSIYLQEDYIIYIREYQLWRTDIRDRGNIRNNWIITSKHLIVVDIIVFTRVRNNQPRRRDPPSEARPWLTLTKSHLVRSRTRPDNTRVAEICAEPTARRCRRQNRCCLLWSAIKEEKPVPRLSLHCLISINYLK